jgi:hypothetical protein
MQCCSVWANTNAKTKSGYLWSNEYMVGADKHNILRLQICYIYAVFQIYCSPDLHLILGSLALVP